MVSIGHVTAQQMSFSGALPLRIRSLLGLAEFLFSLGQLQCLLFDLRGILLSTALLLFLLDAVIVRCHHDFLCAC